MSADNYVTVRRFGAGDYRWAMFSASCDSPDVTDKVFGEASFASPGLAAENANQECMIIEYGVRFEANCLKGG